MLSTPKTTRYENASLQPESKNILLWLLATRVKPVQICCTHNFIFQRKSDLEEPKKKVTSWNRKKFEHKVEVSLETKKKCWNRTGNSIFALRFAILLILASFFSTMKQVHIWRSRLLSPKYTAYFAR